MLDSESESRSCLALSALPRPFLRPSPCCIFGFHQHDPSSQQRGRLSSLGLYTVSFHPNGGNSLSANARERNIVTVHRSSYSIDRVFKGANGTFPHSCCHLGRSEGHSVSCQSSTAVECDMIAPVSTPNLSDIPQAEERYRYK